MPRGEVDRAGGTGGSHGAGERRSSGWFDSHCHLQEQYLSTADGDGTADGDPEADDDSTTTDGGADGALTGALSRAWVAGVDRMVCVGTDAATSAQALTLATASAAGELGASAPRAWATIGLHPHEAAAGTTEVVDMVERSVAHHDRALVAVGECGLDYHYEHSPRSAQREAFAAQAELASRNDLALVIHARDAWDDLFDVLATVGIPDRTILHCFTGGVAEAQRCLDLGMYLSFSGIVTFKNADDVRDAAKRCPLDRLLVETDSPFLAPVPHRGRPNEPAYVSIVGAAVAELHGLAPTEVAGSSSRATTAVFGCPPE